MTMSGEPTSLEKYNFSVGKGRVTKGNFGGDTMEGFFKGSVAIGKKDNDYFANFSFAGGHLADRTAFLQSGAWGLDQSSAEKELNRLREEAEAAAKKADTKPEPKKESEIPEKSGDEPPVEVYEYVPPWERNSPQPGDPPTNEYQVQSELPDPKIYIYDPTAAIARTQAAQAAGAASVQDAGVEKPVVNTEGPSEERKTGETVPNTNPSQVDAPKKDASIPVTNTRVANPESEVSDSVGIQVESKKTVQTFLSSDILKEKAGILLGKISASLREDLQAIRLSKSLSRFAEGSSLHSLEFTDPKTEYLFLTSADAYLKGLESEVAAPDQPSETSSYLIDQYPEQFQSAVKITLSDDSITTPEQAQEKFISLGDTQKRQVLKLFNESVDQHVSSLPNGGDQSNPVKKSAELLKNLGLQRQVMPDDGNCFFFSVAANEQPSERARFSDQSTEANHQRQNLLETFSQLTPEQAQKSFPGQELFKTWQALESGLPTTEDYLSAKDAQSGYNIDSAAWGNSSHLKLNAIRTGKPQVAIDAVSNWINVYHPDGRQLSIDASMEDFKVGLREFITEKAVQVYESLPNHWNAVQVAKE
jgi:hypothetical protein